MELKYGAISVIVRGCLSFTDEHLSPCPSASLTVSRPQGLIKVFDDPIKLSEVV